MQINSGLFPHMVMQRDRRDRCRQPIAGRAAAKAVISVRVERAGKALSGLAKKRLGTADTKGRFHVTLSGLPTGGPYDITLSAGDEELVSSDVLVGDCWVLAGQSNMEGIGDLIHKAPPHALVRAYYMDERWAQAEDPLHVLVDAKAPCHRLISPNLARSTLKGVGPGMAFARRLAERHDVPQGLIPCAHGGTSMEQWKPGTSTKTLFGAMCDRVARNGGRVAGVCWYQGESDTNPRDLAIYTRRMQQLVAAMRKRFGQVPVAVVQIGRVCDLPWTDEAGWMGMREQQRLLPEVISKLATVPSIDLPLDDLIHIGGDGQQELGARLADAIDALRYGRRHCPPPIALGTVKKIRLAHSGADAIEVRFRNVVGRLTAPGLPDGFRLRVGDTSGQFIFRTELHGDRVIIKHTLTPIDIEDASLFYGHGLMPHCTIVDEAGRSLPAFGPIPLGKGYPKTTFGERVVASQVLPVNQTIDTLPYPQEPLRFKRAALENWYNAVPALRRDTTERVVYFRQRIRCKQAMKLDLLLGYDGPVRVWFDREAVFHDENGTNPILADEAVIPLRASAGDHEVLIALGSAAGKALGIALRWGRKDLPSPCPIERKIMPEVIA